MAASTSSHRQCYPVLPLPYHVAPLIISILCFTTITLAYKELAFRPLNGTPKIFIYPDNFSQFIGGGRPLSGISSFENKILEQIRKTAYYTQDLAAADYYWIPKPVRGT